MGMAFAPTWLRQVSPHPLLHMTTLTTEPTKHSMWVRLSHVDKLIGLLSNNVDIS